MIVYLLTTDGSNVSIAIARTVEELVPAIKRQIERPDGDWTPNDGPLNVTVHIGEMDEQDFERTLLHGIG